jgi:phosphatidylethanolamine-binding protein (PEBP) family uncharacterized protein
VAGALVYHDAMRTRPAPWMLLLLATAAGACGGDDDGGAADAPDGGASDFVLTSSAFDEGGEIPLRYTCPPDGDDLSPPLSWSGGPAAAGYAVVLTDLSNQLVHSAIWDIPGGVTSLPEGVEKVAEPSTPAGSKQALAYDGETRGYLGPCPPERHTYEFAVHAVDENPLGGLTLDSTRDEVAAVLEDRALDRARLRADFAPP